MNWWSVFKREMLILKIKFSKMGYVVSSLFYPLIYLFAFGFGLGRLVQMEGGYGAFLCAGMAGISVMNNSFQQTSLSVSVGRVYFKTFQSLMISPVHPRQVAIGLILSGIVRGVLSSLLIYGIGTFFFGGWQLTWYGAIGLIFGSIVFSTMGIIAGMWADGNDGLSIIQNFIMTPMIFFSGSFFPIENLPWFLKIIMKNLPLGMLNQLLQSKQFNELLVFYLFGLLGYGAVFLYFGTHLIKHYEE